MKKSIVNCVLITTGIIIGIVANRNRSSLIDAQFIRDHWHFRESIKEPEKIYKADKVMICLTFGQSNAGNYGHGLYQCKNQVFNYYKGDLYKAKEPLLGPDGPGSTVWTRVADMLIDSGLYDKVIIVPCAIGSTSVECWSEGPCKEKLNSTLKYLKEDGVKLTHIFWLQGETDNVSNTTKKQYKDRLTNLIKSIRGQNIQAPFYSSITSYFPYNNSNPFGIDSNITQAQMEVIREVKDVKAGPNTDSLNLAYYRQSDVHYTEKGLDKLAYEWYKKIKAGDKKLF